MLDGRSDETLEKKGSAGKSENAYSNNTSVNKCGEEARNVNGVCRSCWMAGPVRHLEKRLVP
jgi:hypothetical protein